MYRSAVCSTITIHHNRVFTNYMKLAIMPILASEALLSDKKNSDKMLPPVGIEPGPPIASDSESNTLLSGLT